MRCALYHHLCHIINLAGCYRMIACVCAMLILSFTGFVANAESPDPDELVKRLTVELKQSSVSSFKIAELCEATKNADYIPPDLPYVVSLLTQRKQIQDAEALIEASYLPLKGRYGKPGKDPNQSWELEQYVGIFSKFGYPSKADDVYVNWAKFNEQSFGLRSAKTAEALLQAADYFAKNKRFDISRSYLTKAFQILSSIPAKDAVEATGDLHNIADLYDDGGKTVDTENILRFLINITHQVRSPKECKDTAFSILEIGAQQRMAQLYVDQKRLADARKITLSAVDCLVKNLPASKQSYGDDIRRLVGQLGVSSRLVAIDQVFGALVTTDYEGMREWPTDERTTEDKPKFFAGGRSPLMKFRVATERDSSDIYTNTLTETAIANAAATLGDREMENRYEKLIIAIERNRVKQRGPNFLIQAHKDYAMRLESQGLIDQAANERAEADRVRAEADQAGRDWRERQRLQLPVP